MNSIWTQTVQMPSFEALRGSIKTDVLVIGGGIAGILTAYALKQAGISCVLVEARRLCSGITANTTAKITSQHGLIYTRLLKNFGPEAARAYWSAHEEALRRYEQLSRTIPCDFEIRDNYVYSLDTPVPLEQEMEALRTLDIPADFTNELELPMKTAGAVRFRHQAQFHPLKLLAALAGELTAYEETAVRSMEGATVWTDDGRITAEYIVVATHFPMFNRHGFYFLRMYQSRSYVMALEKAQTIEGMYLDAAEGGLSFRMAGECLLLGGGAHRTGKPGEGWKQLENFAHQHYPLSREVSRWAAQDCMTLDDLPYIGHYSGRTHRLYVATGFRKWGMTSAMVAAQVLCDLIQGKQNQCAEMLAHHRSIFCPQLWENTVEAVKNLLTLSVPRCTHLGCALKWNKQEHTWDCPCHGSRFASDGTLLDNPAKKNLRKKS